MKHAKTLTKVFITLNALNLAAAIAIMTYFLINPVRGLAFNPPFYFFAAVYCLPILFGINLTWLTVWGFSTNRTKVAVVSLNFGVLALTTVLITAAMAFSLIEFTIEAYFFGHLISLVAANAAWLIAYTAKGKKIISSEE